MKNIKHIYRMNDRGWLLSMRTEEGRYQEFFGDTACGGKLKARAYAIDTRELITVLSNKGEGK